MLIWRSPSIAWWLRSGRKFREKLQNRLSTANVFSVNAFSCRKLAFSAANERCGSSPKLPKPVEFLKKLPLEKINFLNRPMSVLHVRIVDFDLQIISYPLVLPDLNLEFGKAVKISPQYHVISAKIFLQFPFTALCNNYFLPIP